MKTFFATLFAAAATARYETVEYPTEVSGDVPTGDFWNHVDDFDAWKEIRDQHEYEERLDTEAELMIALEALREALVDIDRDIDDLDDCLSHCSECISENEEGVSENDAGCHENDVMCGVCEDRVRDLQARAQDVKDALAEDRAVLVLYCQQFAFAPDMVGACADILTCSDTRLSYRADVFSGNHDDGNYGLHWL